MIIKSLPAYYGDSTLISWGTKVKRNILVDGGPGRTYPLALRPLIKDIIAKGECIDLLVVTHIDQDHIGGILKIFEDVAIDKKIIKQIWFNSGNRIAEFFANEHVKSRDLKLIPSDTKSMSFKEGNTLEGYLERLNWPPYIVSCPQRIQLFDAEITVLSPGPNQLAALNQKWGVEKGGLKQMSSGKRSDHGEDMNLLLAKDFISDNSIVNASSISLLIEAEKCSFLLLADAWPGVVEKSLRDLGFNEVNNLLVGAIKVAHHGSKFNNSSSLYSIVKSTKFLVSTDGTRDFLPHKEALARIVYQNPGCELLFNYKKPSEIFTVQERDAYNFSCHHSNEIQL